MKIVLGGPPRTGKSCLRENLKQGIRRLEPGGRPYPYVITANPDGEGSWFQETVARFPDAAAQQKAANKRPFDERHVVRFVEEVKRCQEPLTLVDIGGLISPENRRICQHATHIVILYRTDSELREWRDFAADLELTVLAELNSSHDVTQDTVGPLDTPVLTGTVHGLKRGDLTTPHPTIDALAQRLIDLLHHHSITGHLEEVPMGTTYTIERQGQVLRTAWGDPALGDAIVRDAAARLKEMAAAHELDGGGLIGVNGPGSLPVAMVIAHTIAHLFTAVAMWVPPLHGYLVCISHDPHYKVGDILDRSVIEGPDPTV